MSDEFYEDDEPTEDVRAAWKQGEPDVTSGKKDLNQRSKSIVDQAVERLDAPERPRYRMVLVSGTMTPPARLVNSELPDAVVEEPEYQFG